MADHDPRFTWGLIIGVFGLLERHGYRQGGDQHTGRAIGMLLTLAQAYEQAGGKTTGPAGGHPAGLDSWPWTCRGCGGPRIGRRPPDDRCRELARMWPGGRPRERQVKRQGGHAQRCPLCGVTPRRPPVSADGCISRFRATGAQKLTAGVMTAVQLAEHTALGHGAVTGKPARAGDRAPLADGRCTFPFPPASAPAALAAAPLPAVPWTGVPG